MSDSEDDGLEPLPKLRHFERAPENELLPFKVDGKLIRRFKGNDVKDEIKEEPTDSNEDESANEIDYDVNLNEEDSLEVEKKDMKEERPLTAQELLRKQGIALREVKERISTLSHSIVSFPQENIGRLKELREICANGAGVDVLARESAQKWALASLTEVFVGVAPGYAIRPLSEAESGQKMKSETRKVIGYESTLLHNYQKFLQILERNAMKLVKSNLNEDNFAAKLAFISGKCMCRLLKHLSHFNFSINIVNCLVQLTRSSNAKMLKLVCTSLETCLREDFRLQLSAYIAKTVANFVNVRKGRCRPELLRVFLALRIKEVEKICKQEQEEAEAKRKKEVNGKHMSRNARKERKRRRKVENPLLEAEAAEQLSTKMKLATETMKFVFTTYFRVLKRMATTALVEPVLEGLAKFAHLINVEFFHDLIIALSNLLRQNELKLADSLRCVKTVCVILSNDGQVLSIDPLFFYNSFFAIMPAVTFQDKNAVNAHIAMLVECVDILLVKRRRNVPLKRVAAFVKRMIALAVLVRSRRASLALLSAIRSLFIAHPTLAGTLISTSDDEDCVMNGIFLADSVDPDTCNGLCASIVPELRVLAKQSNDEIIRAFAANLLHHIPSTGEFRLNAKWATRTPISWLEDEEAPENHDSHKSNDCLIRQRFDEYCKKKKITPAASNVCSTLNKFLSQVC